MPRSGKTVLCVASDIFEFAKKNSAGGCSFFELCSSMLFFFLSAAGYLLIELLPGILFFFLSAVGCRLIELRPGMLFLFLCAV
jgi:hypothetical protein